MNYKNLPKPKLKDVFSNVATRTESILADGSRETKFRIDPSVEGAAKGAAAGAAIGIVVPVVGTAIGAVVGGFIGLIFG